MNILHVMATLSPEAGGPQHALLGMAGGVARRGHSVTIAYVNSPGRDASFPARAMSGVTTIAFPPSFPRRFRASRSLGRWMRQSLGRFDVVHIHAIFTVGTLTAGSECRRAGIPYIVRPHGSLDPYDLRKKAWLKKVVGPLLIRHHLSGAAAVHCTSRREAERLVTYGAQPRIVVAPLPVLDATRVSDTRRNQNSSPRTVSFRDTLGIGPEHFLVLFMSRLDKKKNLDVLIEAIRRIAPNNPKVHLAVCGTGDPAYETHLKASARDVAGAGLVTFCGFLRGRQKADALLESDAFVLPSSNENYGVAVVEALHAGIPVICSDQVYISDDIADAEAGIVCSPTPDDVAAALLHLLEDRARGGELVKVMSRHGQELARGRFSEESCVPALLEMYKSALVLRSAMA
jgi:glycosyltransferase involved in cell wall biosynthesis